MFVEHMFNTFRNPSVLNKRKVNEPDVCPICKRGIRPISLSDYCVRHPEKTEQDVFVITFVCTSCYKPFIAYYGNGRVDPVLLAPVSFDERTFEDRIIAISPKFVAIYNQSLEAESRGLNEISGMGYRKALEFLIKDYLIHCEPEQRETIEAMQLGNCIANKLTNDKLKAVASRAVWLGNDFTHYNRKFEEFEIADLKRFIDTCIFWILSELTVEEALAIERR